MASPTILVKVPEALLRRASLHTSGSARELVVFLLEKRAQELEQAQRRQAYEAYYASRTPEEQAEEVELLDEFAAADAEISDKVMP